MILCNFSLTFCGHTELAPAATTQSSLYQLPDFEMPVPENRGSTVRNLQAFQVGFDAFNSCFLNVKGWVMGIKRFYFRFYSQYS